MTVRQPESSQDSIESNRAASDASASTGTSAGSSSDSLIGRLLRGTYRIIGALDEGGMGKLYRAEHQRLRRPVAVKVMAQYLSANREALARFRREAEIVSQLDHPHIVHILDFDTTEHGDPYIVMELLTGESLSRRLDQLQILPLRDTIAVVSQIASALTAAHRAGIVHRDLKPDNVFLLAMRDESIFIKLLDFGISKGSPKSARVTGKYDVLGTPDYMAPEQALDTARVDHHADQWSLACMAYEMLTGHVPFAGDSAVQILAKVVTEPPPPLTHYIPDIHSSLQGIVMRGLAKDPFQRFPTIGDFAEHLSRAAQAIISSDSWVTETHEEPVRNAEARAATLDANPRQRTTKQLRPAARANPAQPSAESAYSSVLPEQRSLSGSPSPQAGLSRESPSQKARPARARLRGSARSEEGDAESARTGSDRIRRPMDDGQRRQGGVPAVTDRAESVALPETTQLSISQSTESILRAVKKALATGDFSLALLGARAALRLAREQDSPQAASIITGSAELLVPVLLQALGGKHRTISLVNGPSSKDNSLSPTHMFLASRIDRATTIEELLDVSPLSNAETLGVLLDFRDEGFLTVD